MFIQLLREGVSTNSPFFLNFVLNDLRVGKGKLLFKEICYLFNEKTPHSATPVIDSSCIPPEAALPCLFPEGENQYHPYNSLPKNVRQSLPELLELNSSSGTMHGKEVCV